MGRHRSIRVHQGVKIPLQHGPHRRLPLPLGEDGLHRLIGADDLRLPNDGQRDAKDADLISRGYFITPAPVNATV